MSNLQTIVTVAPLPLTVLRLGEVMRGRSTVYLLIAEKDFRPRCRLGVRAVCWRNTDIEQWSVARPVTRR